MSFSLNVIYHVSTAGSSTFPAVQRRVFDTGEEHITADMFDKENGKYIEERKTKAVLINPVESPSLLPDYGDRKQDSSSETTIPKDMSPAGVENASPFLKERPEVIGYDFCSRSYNPEGLSLDARILKGCTCQGF